VKGRLTVIGSSPTLKPMQREIPANAGECPAVQRITVTLIRAWLESPRLGSCGEGGTGVSLGAGGGCRRRTRSRV